MIIYMDIVLPAIAGIILILFFEIIGSDSEDSEEKEDKEEEDE